jgi:hypothetical protein
MAGVGSGNSDVGSGTLNRPSGQPIVEHPGSSGGFTGLRLDHKMRLQREAASKCGAMSEQSADSGRGNEQVPQKLVHLVGTCDPSARLSWVRPRGG